MPFQTRMTFFLPVKYIRRYFEKCISVVFPHTMEVNSDQHSTKYLLLCSAGLYPHEDIFIL